VMFWNKDGKAIETPGVIVMDGGMGPFPKLLAAKLKAHKEGSKLNTPSSLPEQLCCYVCPFLCGCSYRLALAGTLEVKGHPTIAGLTVTGALASQDEAVGKKFAEAVGLQVMSRAGDKSN